MKKTALLFAACILLLTALVSCSTFGKTINVVFRSQGQEVATVSYRKGGTIVLPENPVREGHEFYGWWITCDNGVLAFDQQWLDENLPEEDIVVNARWENVSWQLETAFQTSYIQDGVIYGDLLFKFDSKGRGLVYDMNSYEKVGTILLDHTEIMLPHSNSVCFGSKICEGSSFPLLYSNVYTSYKTKFDRQEGTLCVYKITNDGPSYTTELVQLIRIGFTTDKNIWMSHVTKDRSPYGNFIVDTDNNKLWAFVTRDEYQTTRFFCFDLPELGSGTYKSAYQCEEVVLQATDIEFYFDVPYSFYLQGACYRDGKIYSTEGMGTSYNPPCVRVIDLNAQAEDSFIAMFSDSYQQETEFIDYWNGDFYFSDNTKVIYKLKGI